MKKIKLKFKNRAVRYDNQSSNFPVLAAFDKSEYQCLAIFWKAS